MILNLIPLNKTRTSFKNSMAACRINKPSSQIWCILYNESFLVHLVIHKEGGIDWVCQGARWNGGSHTAIGPLYLRRKEGHLPNPMCLRGLFLWLALGVCLLFALPLFLDREHYLPADPPNRMKWNQYKGRQLSQCEPQNSKLCFGSQGSARRAN